ncbi:hypothetical protein [Kurthia sibirica]|uniref:DUF3870 domain-containing protein n=1 Tax=Kurthia sibirica TaxID=202750 RepID=A0A2U3AN95_9BACL|nr:hypothetical protein [Kurthia sibirica]PWI26020.1 hypothetical protein DEX24_05685 [Kurthia sibirica]GEK34580.1 hypothetical protein KSI01_21130 [Kurthia sibirica]
MKNDHWYIIDYAWHGQQTLFVDLQGTANGQNFTGMVRIVDRQIYGDLVNPMRSNLDQQTIDKILLYLQEKIEKDFFTPSSK